MQGSGKTLAFGLPILQRLMLMKSESLEGTKTKLKALILTPTRELALQVSTSLASDPNRGFSQSRGVPKFSKQASKQASYQTCM